MKASKLSLETQKSNLQFHDWQGLLVEPGKGQCVSRMFQSNSSYLFCFILTPLQEWAKDDILNKSIL